MKGQGERRGLEQPQELFDALKTELLGTLDAGDSSGVWTEAESEATPYVILVVGVNGSGKTPVSPSWHTISRKRVKKWSWVRPIPSGPQPSTSCRFWGSGQGVDVISHQSGADPGAVAFDAFQASKARGADVLIIDTAGRLHTKSNLMEELKKVVRVLNRLDAAVPHQVLLVLDATTGHNGLSQAGLSLRRWDAPASFWPSWTGPPRGGIVLAIKRELGLPILFVGTGEKSEDMAPFDPREFVDAILEPVAAHEVP